MKKHRLYLIAGLVVGLAAAHVVIAQPSSPFHADSLQRAVTELTERIEMLEAQLAELNSGETSYIVAEEALAGRGNAIYLPMRGQPVLPPETTPTANLDFPDEIDEPRLEISGFFDGVAEVHPTGGRRGTASLNQVEIDVARGIGQRGEAFLAVVFDETFGVGAATVSYHLVSRTAGDGAPTHLLESWTATAGQFDVPVGIDCQRYASIDRPTITQPAVCAATHGGWNDLGVQSSIAGRYGGVDVYAVRGLETTIWNSEDDMPPDVAEDDERWLTLTPNASGGARLRLTLVPGLEWGGSVARGFQHDGQAAFTLAGLHAHGQWGAWSLQAEALHGRFAEQHQPFVVRGGYLEGLYDFGRLYTTARYDVLDSPDAADNRYYGIGAGVRIVENLHCRTEFVTSGGSMDNRLLLQIAAAF